MEVVIDPPLAPGVATGPALDVAGAGATLHGAVTPHNQATTYRFEYGTGGFDARTPDGTLAPGAPAVDVEATLTGLVPAVTYRYRLVAVNATGATTGPERTFVAGAPPGYRDMVLGTPGLMSYWRLGEASGRTAVDERGAHAGSYAATGVTLGRPGALSGDPDTSASFDGVSGEMSVSTPVLSTSGTLEGWFEWQAGVAVMRDHNASPGTGWILAFESGGRIACRAGGTNLVSSTTVASIRDGWHHYALTREGDDVRLYLDGRRLDLPATPPGNAASSAPWHIMRNGSSAAQYTRGRADEVAVYDRRATRRRGRGMRWIAAAAAATAGLLAFDAFSAFAPARDAVVPPTHRSTSPTRAA